MNTSRNAGGEIARLTARVVQVPSLALTARIEMHVNPTTLTDGEVSTMLVQMDQASTLQAQVIGFD